MVRSLEIEGRCLLAVIGALCRRAALPVPFFVVCLTTQTLHYLQPEVQSISDWVERVATKLSGANVVALRA